MKIKYWFEIKYRGFLIIYSFICFFFIFFNYNIELLYILTNNLQINYFITTNILDFFFIIIQNTFFFSIFYIIYPIFLQIYLFYKNILYRIEKKKLKFYFLLILKLSIIINLSTYYILPFIINFILKQEKIYNLVNPIKFFFQLNIFEYLILIYYWILININILLFLLILYYFLKKYKLNNINKWIKYKKLIFIFILIISGILTPPDIFSQIIFTIILIFILEIFYFNIIFSKINNKK